MMTKSPELSPIRPDELKKTETGCTLISNMLREDSRGWFSELYRESTFPVNTRSMPEVEGIFPDTFPQSNVSFSKAAVLRGMHYQTKNPQAKLVRVLAGEVIDVVIDCRKYSSTFSVMESFRLDHKSPSLFIPAGFAHGFVALENTIFHYQCSEEFNPEADDGFSPLDPSFKFPWMPSDTWILSDKDRTRQSFAKFIASLQ